MTVTLARRSGLRKRRHLTPVTLAVTLQGARNGTFVTADSRTVILLARYARPSAEDPARWQERNDPVQRR